MEAMKVAKRGNAPPECYHVLRRHIRYVYIHAEEALQCTHVKADTGRRRRHIHNERKAEDNTWKAA
jgi:hypothetical protein